jgi:hypothetical protein
MPEPISSHDALMRPGVVVEQQVLSWDPMLHKKFLFRESSIAVKARCRPRENENRQAASIEQAVDNKAPDVLLRLPSIRESKLKVTLLQRWIGDVEEVKGDRFFAVLHDATNDQNPPELGEFECAEVSPSDIPLLAEGARFYWSIGYTDTPGGQRQRVSELRFARRSRLTESEISLILEQADTVVALLENE